MSIILLLHIIMLAFTFGHVELLTVDYHSIDTPIAELNNHTLREVFEDGNLFVNGDFSNGTTGWQVINGSLTIVQPNGNFYSNGTSPLDIRKTISLENNNDYYFVNNYSSATNANNLGAQILMGDQFIYNSTLSEMPYNIIFTTTSAHTQARWLIYGELVNGDRFSLGSLYLISQTTLGISSLTVAQMDTYFQMYQDNISGNDVTYTQNEMTITDLTYIIGFGFIWFVIIWSIRKVVL